MRYICPRKKNIPYKLCQPEPTFSVHLFGYIFGLLVRIFLFAIIFGLPCTNFGSDGRMDAKRKTKTQITTMPKSSTIRTN